MAEDYNPFTDIEYRPPEMRTSPTAYQTAKTLQIGYGENVLRANSQGLWLGRNTFEEAQSATFAVAMDGTISATGLVVGAGDVIISGATTLADWRHPSALTTINGGDIYTGSITASKITVTTLSALSANLGTVTAGTYQTAGITTRIKIQDDNILWQYKSGSWYDAGELQGANISYTQLGGGVVSGYGLELINGHTINIMEVGVIRMERFYATSPCFVANDFGATRVYAYNGTTRLYKAVAGSNISVSYNSTTSEATIALAFSGQLDMNSNDIINIDDCKAVKFWGNGSGGITGSHSWVNSEGDTVDIQVKGGIVYNFTVT